jgi:hypothetical protein
LFAFFPAFPCLYLGIETLFAFFVRPGHFSVGWKSGKSALPTDRVCMRTSLICPGRTILSKRQGRGTSSCLLEPSPCPFELQKRRLSRLLSDNRLFGVPAGKISDRYKCIPLLRPTVQCVMAKSLIARKDRSSTRVL